MISVDKALCLPFGSFIVGSSEFIGKFNRNRRLFGGVFRKMGMFAAMGVVALKTVRF